MESSVFPYENDEPDSVFAALGDPLIKGLTEVANVKPKDPVAFLATFLHNFPDQEKPRLGTQVIIYILYIIILYIIILNHHKSKLNVQGH